ncbi:MAG: DNA-binding protein [Bacteroidetes bacterium]|nr:MAG: DNA-binding protein [Bacteroidota bacterium]
MKNEIIIYQSDETTKVEVKVEDETVWLTLNQIALLFNRDKSVISRHLKNIYNSGELLFEATVAKNATLQLEGGRKIKREIDYYNLDVIISVGYRINSKQGTQFRIWATKVLKKHLLRGYTVNKRIDRVEDKVDILSDKVDEINLQLNTNLPPNQGIFFDGQIFDAYNLMANLVRKTNKQIVLIDNYVDDSVLTFFAKKNKNVTCDIFTKNISKPLKQDAEKFNRQYGKLTLHPFNKAHDRFLILDNTEVYHIGASLKDLGKKWFAFTKLDKTSIESLLNKIRGLL